MSSAPSRLKALLQKYLSNNCTADELQEFWPLMFEFSEDIVISAELQKLWAENNDGVNTSSNVNWDEVYEKLQHKKNSNKETGDTNVLCEKTGQASWLNILVPCFTAAHQISFFMKGVVALIAADINNIKHLYIRYGHSNCELK